MNQHNQKKYFKSKEVSKVLFARCISATDRDIYELYYINLYSPKYNDKQNYGQKFSFELPELEFVEYHDDVKLRPVKYATQQLTINTNEEAIENNIVTEQRITNMKSILSTSSYKLSLLEQKLLLYMMKIIDENDKEKTYKVYVSDFQESTNVKSRGSIYMSLKQISDNYNTQQIILNNKCIDIYDYIEYGQGYGYLNIKFNNEFFEILLQHKKCLSQKEIDNTLLLSSTYSIRMYQILKSLPDDNIFSINELKYMLGIKEDKYTRFDDIKFRMLTISQKELSEKLNFIYKYNLIKRSRKVDALEFEIVSE
jgi:hypothetical protein